MSVEVPSGDSTLKEFADKILSRIWVEEESNKKVPFDRFCTNKGVITEKSLEAATSDYYEERQQIFEKNPKIKSAFLKVMGSIDPSQRSTTTLSDIIVGMDREIHPAFYLEKDVRRCIPGSIKLSTDEDEFIHAFCEIWANKEKCGEDPLRVFCDSEGSITEESVNAVFSDYSGISQRIGVALTKVMNRLNSASDGAVNISTSDLPKDIVRDVIDILHPPVTRFEKARIIGARALQISYGAPILVEYPDDMVDPIDIAFIEYRKGLIPITVVKNEPN